MLSGPRAIQSGGWTSFFFFSLLLHPLPLDVNRATERNTGPKAISNFPLSSGGLSNMTLADTLLVSSDSVDSIGMHHHSLLIH